MPKLNFTKNTLKNGNYHGYWELFFLSDGLLGKGVYDNNKKIGYWRYYSFNSVLKIIEYNIQ